MFLVFSDIYKNCWLYSQNKKNSTGQNDIAFRNIILHLVVVVARHRAFTNSAIERQCINAVVKYYKSAVFVKISFLDVFELSNMVANSDIWRYLWDSGISIILAAYQTITTTDCIPRIREASKYTCIFDPINTPYL